MSEHDENRDRATMADVSHTNPYTGETLGASFRRGGVALDGGWTNETETMGDVDHRPRNGEGSNRVWERGSEATPEARRATGGATDLPEEGPTDE